MQTIIKNSAQPDRHTFVSGSATRKLSLDDAAKSRVVRAPAGNCTLAQAR
jgi:hypothetical protein